MGKIRSGSLMSRKIEQAVELFKKVYMKRGYFRQDWGKGPGTENTPDYREALTGHFSNIVGNSSFSPRIRRAEYRKNEGKYPYWTIPDSCYFVFSLHPHIRDGVTEVIRPGDINEIRLETNNMGEVNDDEIVRLIREFLSLTNEEVIAKYIKDPSILSQASRDKLAEVDRRNELIAQAEESLQEGKKLDFELNIEHARPVRIREDLVIM